MYTDEDTFTISASPISFQGFFMALMVAFLIFLRYGLKNLLIESLPCTWDNCVYEPGDIIALNEPFVPDRKAGVMGVNGQTFEILDRTWRFMAGIVEFKLLSIDLSKFKQFLITPNGEADYAAASTLDKGKYMFQCDTTGLYSNGDPGNTLG
jgi:hypothetical protein